MKESFRFDTVFIIRFFRIIKVIFPRLWSSATLLFAFLLTLCLLEQVVVYAVGILPSKFYKTLGDKDSVTFKPLLIYSFILIFSVAVISSTVNYVSSVLYIVWRRNLTLLLHSNYFKLNNYYNVNILRTGLDNPDQRITQDVDRMCKQFSTVLTPLIISPFTIGYYSYQAVLSTGYLGPVSILAFFILGTIFNKLLMSPVVEKVFAQEKQEGNFRYKHMDIRCHAESAAFYRCSGELEECKTNVKLLNLLTVQNDLIRKQYALNCVVKLFDYSGSILSYIVLAVPIFAGHYDSLKPTELSELISKNGFVCIYLISCFTKLLDQALTVTDVAGTAHRIGELLENLDDISRSKTTFDMHHINCHQPRASSDDKSGSSEDRDDNHSLLFEMDNISITTPNSSELIIKGLSCSVKRGDSLLITGASSCGKTSIIRALAGLWPVSEGQIRLYCSADDIREVLFLPQRPYLTNGTLREQIIFPKSVHALNRNRLEEEDARILEILNVTQLTHLVDRTNGLDECVIWNWYDVLSPGEMQRLSFARLFYHKPTLAVLDEVTSGVSTEMESVLYHECIRLGMTILSIGHRDTLDKYHKQKLHIKQYQYTRTSLSIQ